MLPRGGGAGRLACTCSATIPTALPSRRRSASIPHASFFVALRFFFRAFCLLASLLCCFSMRSSTENLSKRKRLPPVSPFVLLRGIRERRLIPPSFAFYACRLRRTRLPAFALVVRQSTMRLTPFFPLPLLQFLLFLFLLDALPWFPFLLVVFLRRLTQVGPRLPVAVGSSSLSLLWFGWLRVFSFLFLFAVARTARAQEQVRKKGRTPMRIS